MQREGWEIIGSTVPVDMERLPQRLSPIYRDPKREGVVVLPVGDENVQSAATFGVEDDDWLEGQVLAGVASYLNPPFPYRPGHCLLLLEPQGYPIQVPLEKLEEHLQLAHTRALERAADAVRDRDFKSAAYWIDYVLRADDSPQAIHRLAALAIKRSRMGRGRIEQIEEQLANGSARESVSQGLKLWRDRSGYQPLIELLREDPFARRLLEPAGASRLLAPRPAYLPPATSLFSLEEARRVPHRIHV